MDYKKILTFSFDDGVTQDIRFIELLDKYGLKCTFNLNSELLGKDGYLTINDKKINHNKIHPDKVRDVYKNHEIAAHTLTHPHLTTVSEDEIIRQVEKDKENLSVLAGYNVRGFAYPGGGVNCNRFVADVIKDKTSVEFARTIMHSYNFEIQDDMYLFKPTISFLKEKDETVRLCNEFINLETDDIKLFYIWGHSYEMDINDDWAFVEEILKKLGGREDILYCTNSEAFDYINNYKK
jgi:peptidoglycan/xylan/chitin deacetylase (PgdA/CDA1 family)